MFEVLAVLAHPESLPQATVSRHHCLECIGQYIVAVGQETVVTCGCLLFALCGKDFECTTKHFSSTHSHALALTVLQIQKDMIL